MSIETEVRPYMLKCRECLNMWAWKLSHIYQVHTRRQQIINSASMQKKQEWNMS